MDSLTPKNALLRASLLTLITVILVLSLVYLVRTNNQNLQAQAGPKATDVQTTPSPNSPIRDFTPLIAYEGQPPILTEFGDFQCPYCARFAVSVMPKIRKDLIKPGLVQFEYRHYPFLGSESYMAAEASECARDQDQFQQYHDQLYLSIISGAVQSISADLLHETARLISLNLSDFAACFSNRTHEDRVKHDKAYGRSLGVQGTPSLFIDGRKINWESYEDLKDQIADHIAQSN